MSLDTNKEHYGGLHIRGRDGGQPGWGQSQRPDQAFYGVGEQVTLSATAGRWHVFSRWTDEIPTTRAW